MRLLILGSLNRPAVTQLAMDRGTTVTDAADIARTLAVLRAGRGADLLMVDVAVDIRALVRGLAADHIDIQHAAVAAEPVSRALVGRAVAEVERDLTLETLKHCLGNRTHAANVLGISIRTLRNKLNEYAVDSVPVPPPGGAIGGEPRAAAQACKERIANS